MLLSLRVRFGPWLPHPLRDWVDVPLGDPRHPENVYNRRAVAIQLRALNFWSHGGQSPFFFAGGQLYQYKPPRVLLQGKPVASCASASDFAQWLASRERAACLPAEIEQMHL
jgi:hypothetical protein